MTEIEPMTFVQLVAAFERGEVIIGPDGGIVVTSLKPGQSIHDEALREIVRRVYGIDGTPAVKLPWWRRFRAGILLRWGSFWIGLHWSPANKRLCINLVPFVTFWVTAPGGKVP